MIYLVQTDTTAGFLSKNLSEINSAKKRALNQPCLITTASFCELKQIARVPKKFKNLVRKARKTTFIYPNLQSVRVVKDDKHSEFLRVHGWMYSSSANLHNQNFDLAYAKSVADEVIGDNFAQSKPSKIYKLHKTKIKKIRD